MNQITIVYDDKNEVARICAKQLYTLISERKELIKSLKLEYKKFEGNSITSGNYVVYIGKCGKETKGDFKSKFNKYGLEIGYYGTQAWIVPEDQEILNEDNKYKEFIEAFKALYDKHESFDKDITEPVKKDDTFGKILDHLAKDFGFKLPPVTSAVQDFLFGALNIGLCAIAFNSGFIYEIIRKLKSDFDAAQFVAGQQLKFGTVKFFDDYLYEYLELDEKKE